MFVMWHMAPLNLKWHKWHICINVFVPFFPAWSSQFSKVQGPQAPHGDTSQSMGQGMWHSWDLLGIGPSHSPFSTGREAVHTNEKEKRENEQQMQWTCSTLILSEFFMWIVFLTASQPTGTRDTGCLFTLLPGIKIPIESRWERLC